MTVSSSRHRQTTSGLELWGGVECTVNRVRDRFRDQCVLTGHDVRADDLEHIASLGIRVLRYPVLWERIAPDGLARADWAWTDARLEKLRALGIRPVVTLVHHGSGPRSTDLLDPDFPSKLAGFAHAVASRYPWIDDVTPINEPLTTARFSALYGHWYPHHRDARSFTRAFLHQVRGVVESMRAIRAVNPRARLVQTEDLGLTRSTPLLAYQAEHENHRRWLTFDALCGMLDARHPLLGWLLEHGALDGELQALVDTPCPPDVLGINYYLTSERHLDERMQLYPAWSHGGNQQHAYADIEAVRVRAEGIHGHAGMLADTWARYRRPVAVTEVHLGCTREDQVRWVHEAWEAARRVRDDGADVRAVCIWGLMGMVDWSSLMCREENRYEPGAFDVRAPSPRITAIGRAARDLARTGVIQNPVVDEEGWWRREQRIIHPPVGNAPVRERRVRTARPILVTGATGTLGRAFARIAGARYLTHQLLARADLDIASPASVENAIARWQPWAIINAAGYVRVDDAETDRARCERENTLGPEVLASSCAAHGVRLVTFSSDLVFDGARTQPYLESDVPHPLNVYGHSKALAEERVLRRHPGALVVRTSAFMGAWDPHNVVAVTLRRLAQGLSMAAADDQTVSPTFVPDLVYAVLDLLIDGESGLWHLCNQGEVTWAALARQVAELAGLRPSLVVGKPSHELGLAAARPRYSVLRSMRGELMPPLDDALRRCIAMIELERYAA